MNLLWVCLLLGIFLVPGGSSRSRRPYSQGVSRNYPWHRQLDYERCNPACKNGGTCYGRQCWCTPEYKGTYCQYHRSRCSEHAFQQLGPRGGIRCEENVPLENTKHPHTCTLLCDGFFEFAPASKYTCDYTTGRFIPSRIPRCLREPVGRDYPTQQPTHRPPDYYHNTCRPACRNGGVCYNGVCKCPSEWKGTHCQYHQSRCKHDILIHPAGYERLRCQEQPQFARHTVPYTCTLYCARGHPEYTPASTYTCDYATGRFTPMQVPQCITDENRRSFRCSPRCQNGGRCTSGHTRNYCQCPAGYTGDACQYRRWN